MNEADKRNIIEAISFMAVINILNVYVFGDLTSDHNRELKAPPEPLIRSMWRRMYRRHCRTHWNKSKE